MATWSSGTAPSAGLGVSARVDRHDDVVPRAIRLGRGYVPWLILLVAAYYGAAHIGYALAFAGPVAAILWPPVGVAVAFLYLAGLRFWPGVVVGDLLVNNYSALPLGSAIGQTAGNLLEVLLAVVLMRRLVRGSPLDSVRSLTGMLVAIAAGTRSAPRSVVRRSGSGA